jgi:signal transduction histidine kinase
MNGGLEVTSRPGSTTFTLTLPLAGEREQPAAAQAPPAEVSA